MGGFSEGTFVCYLFNSMELYIRVQVRLFPLPVDNTMNSGVVLQLLGCMF